MVKVLLVTNIPTPYRIPLFNELNKQLAEAGVGFKVAFAALGYSRRKWAVDMTECRFDYVILRSRTFMLGRNAEHTLFTYRGLLRIIREFSPSVIVVPGFSVATMKVWLLSFLGQTTYLIWSGSVARKGHLDSRVRLWLRRLLAKRVAGAVAYGSQAKAYLQGLGIPDANIYIAVNTVDTDFFQRATACLREQLGTTDKKYLTYIGYLSARKNVRRVLDVVAHLHERRNDFVLEIIGAGEDFDILTSYVKEKHLNDVVIFCGYRQKEELPQFLARSRCLLFQTDFDIWGLVLNEAMAAGVPCLASVHAGAMHDLIEDGVTGFAVDFANAEHVAGKINWLLDHPVEAAQMGQQARRYIAEEATIERSAKGFVDAILQT